jgi:eukaryotic-like serine/threonine-protein kinase
MLAGRYHLQRLLGRGAMGAVWEADDTVLRRPVAVKEVVLPPGLSPEERAVSCERTLREARAIARLGHPNVVTLFDVLDEDSRPWVVMELVPSRSLADVIKEDGPIHPHRAATVGLAILSALEAAHAAGITHRDVKPGNILLGHDGRVKLTDFGIARAAGDTTITGTGLLVGSPSYLAPEIVRGQEAGPAGDLWGLGATLYAAVEGRAPFAGVDAMDTLAKVVQDPPAPFNRAGPLVPALSAMLNKDPLRRASPVLARRLLLEVLRGGDTATPPAPDPRPATPPIPDTVPPLVNRQAARWARAAAAAADDRPAQLPGLPGLAAAEAAARARLQADGEGDRGWRGQAPPAPFLSSVGHADPPEAVPPGGSSAPDGLAAGVPAGFPAPAEPLDAGPLDAGPGDAGQGDAGQGDAGREDAARGETRHGNAGYGDADHGDADYGDADHRDADHGDAGDSDAGHGDAGYADARYGDAGPVDVGHAGGSANSASGLVGAAAGAAAAGAVAHGQDGAVPYGDAVWGDGAAVGPDGAAASYDAPYRYAERGGDPAGPAPGYDAQPPYGQQAGNPAGPPPGYDAQPPYGQQAGNPAGPAPGYDAQQPYDQPAGNPASYDARPSYDQPAGNPAGPAPGYDAQQPYDQPGGNPAGPAPGYDAQSPYGQPAGNQTNSAPGHDPQYPFGPQGWGGGPGAGGGVAPIDEASFPFGEHGWAAGATEQFTPGQFAADEEPTQVVGPLGPGSFGAPARGGDDGRRRRLVLAALAVAGLVLIVVIGGVLAAKAFFGGSPAAQPTTTTQAPTPTRSTPAGVPAGYSLYRHPGGFSVAVPRGWEPQVKPRGVVDVRDPASSRFLRLIRTSTGADPLAQLTAAEGTFKQDHQDYHRVRLESVDYHGYPTADWEFTYSNDGSIRRVLYRSFQVDGASYAIYLSAPEAQWTDSRRFFDTATATFARG